MKKVLVIGASRGIGLEFCRQYRALGWQVEGAVRAPSPELKAMGVGVHVGVDVASLASLQQLAHDLRGEKLDLIVHNAGILKVENFPEIDLASVIEQLEVNSLGPLRTAMALSSSINSGGKLVFLTSRMGSIADNGSGGYYGYRMSKAALNAAGKSLAIDLKRQGVSVGLLHPGYVQTDMTQRKGEITPEQAVQGMIRVIEGLNLHNSGHFWHSNGENLPW